MSYLIKVNQNNLSTNLNQDTFDLDTIPRILFTISYEEYKQVGSNYFRCIIKKLFTVSNTNGEKYITQSSASFIISMITSYMNNSLSSIPSQYKIQMLYDASNLIIDGNIACIAPSDIIGIPQRYIRYTASSTTTSSSSLTYSLNTSLIKISTIEV